MVGLGRLELPTSPLSGVRSNQTELQARIYTIGFIVLNKLKEKRGR